MLFTRAFKWNGVQGGADLKGKEHSLRFSGAMGNGWQIEASHLDFDNRPDEQRVKLTYVRSFGQQKEKSKVERSLISDEMFSLASLRNQRLMPIRRENRIVKQTSGLTISYRR